MRFFIIIYVENKLNTYIFNNKKRERIKDMKYNKGLKKNCLAILSVILIIIIGHLTKSFFYPIITFLIILITMHLLIKKKK